MMNEFYLKQITFAGNQEKCRVVINYEHNHHGEECRVRFITRQIKLYGLIAYFFEAGGRTHNNCNRLEVGGTSNKIAIATTERWRHDPLVTAIALEARDLWNGIYNPVESFLNRN